MSNVPTQIAKGMQSLERLKAAHELLEKFRKRNVESLDQRQRHLLNEGGVRTVQMVRLLEIVIQLMRVDRPASMGANRSLDLQTMTESFYYFAHRALKTLRHHPQLKAIEAKGIRIVRNKLLDHSEGADSGVLDITFLCSPWTGPIVKGPRAVGSAAHHRDAGLWANVDEFSEALTSILQPLVTGAE